MEVDARIGQAIALGLAASRWRVASQSQDQVTAARYWRLAGHRSRQAAALLDEVAAGAANAGHLAEE